MDETEVIDTNLLIEGRVGLTTAFNIVEYPKALEKKIEVLWPVKADFLTATEIMIDLMKSRTPVPALDILVAAICLNRRFKLATKDEHFKVIKAVRQDLNLSLR